MPLHPDTPDERRSDPETYARWRIEHLDAREVAIWRRRPLDEMMAFFRDEFWESRETPDSIAMEDAEIESSQTANKH
jgi:hypothetical protein